MLRVEETSGGEVDARSVNLAEVVLEQEPTASLVRTTLLWLSRRCMGT